VPTSLSELLLSRIAVAKQGWEDGAYSVNISSRGRVVPNHKRGRWNCRSVQPIDFPLILHRHLLLPGEQEESTAPFSITVYGSVKMYSVSICEQTEHAQVVAARANEFWLFYNALSDPDTIRSLYSYTPQPDIIVLDRESNILFIEKVQTEKSASAMERDQQWIKYSNLGYSFNVIIPKLQVPKARELVKDLPINRLYYYEFTPMRIRFRHLIK
jgi:hypothetical protein